MIFEVWLEKIVAGVGGQVRRKQSGGYGNTVTYVPENSVTKCASWAGALSCGVLKSCFGQRVFSTSSMF